MNKRKCDGSSFPYPKKIKLSLEKIEANDNVKVKETVFMVALDEAGSKITNSDDVFEVKTENIAADTINIKIRSRKYALRKRNLAPKQEAAATTKTTATTTPAATTTATANKIVKIVNEIQIENEKFKVGEIVLAKTKGYCHWPALITKISGVCSLTVEVMYFGSHQRAKINYKNKAEKMLVKYKNGKEIMKGNADKYRGTYNAAVSEAAHALKESKKKNK